MGQPPAHGVPLSGPGTGPPPWHATKLEVKNHHGGLPGDGPIEVNARSDFVTL